MARFGKACWATWSAIMYTEKAGITLVLIGGVEVVHDWKEMMLAATVGPHPSCDIPGHTHTPCAHHVCTCQHGLLPRSDLVARCGVVSKPRPSHWFWGDPNAAQCTPVEVRVSRAHTTNDKYRVLSQDGLHCRMARESGTPREVASLLRPASTSTMG